MKNIILENIDQEFVIYKDKNYEARRHAGDINKPNCYTKKDGTKITEFCYIEADGTKITEPIYSFNIYHEGVHTSSYVNMRESQCDDADVVVQKFKTMVDKLKAERITTLLQYRAEKRMFPTKDVWKFKNVTITLIQEFSRIGYKRYSIYTNETPIRRHHDHEVENDLEIGLDFCLDAIHGGVRANYNVNKLSEVKLKYVNVKKHKAFNFNFLPFQFYLGYAIKFKGVEYYITDYWGCGVLNNSLKTSTESIPVDTWDFKDIEIVGELQGMTALPALMNKTKFIE